MKLFRVIPALFAAGLMLAGDVKPALAQITTGTPEVEKIEPDRDREHRRRHRPVRPHRRDHDRRVVRPDRPERRDRPDRPARPDRPVRR